MKAFYIILFLVFARAIRSQLNIQSLKDMMVKKFDDSLEKVYDEIKKKQGQNQSRLVQDENDKALLKNDIELGQKEQAPKQDNIDKPITQSKADEQDSTVKDNESDDNRKLCNNYDGTSRTHSQTVHQTAKIRIDHPTGQVRGFISSVKSVTGPDGKTIIQTFSRPIKGDINLNSIENVQKNPLITNIEKNFTPFASDELSDPRNDPLGLLHPILEDIDEAPQSSVTEDIGYNPIQDILNGLMTPKKIKPIRHDLSQFNLPFPIEKIENIDGNRIRRVSSSNSNSKTSSSDSNNKTSSSSDSSEEQPKAVHSVDSIADLLGNFLDKEIGEHESKKQIPDEDNYHRKKVHPKFIVIEEDDDPPLKFNQHDNEAEYHRKIVNPKVIMMKQYEDERPSISPLEDPSFFAQTDLTKDIFGNPIKPYVSTNKIQFNDNSSESDEDERNTENRVNRSPINPITQLLGDLFKMKQRGETHYPILNQHYGPSVVEEIVRLPRLGRRRKKTFEPTNLDSFFKAKKSRKLDNTESAVESNKQDLIR